MEWNALISDISLSESVKCGQTFHSSWKYLNHSMRTSCFACNGGPLCFGCTNSQPRGNPDPLTSPIRTNSSQSPLAHFPGASTSILFNFIHLNNIHTT